VKVCVEIDIGIFSCTIEWVWTESESESESESGDRGSGNGEPHFRMWNNIWFDYQGQCDLVLIDNPHLSTGAGVRVHVRTKIRSWYSFIQEAAIQIDSEVLEIHAQKAFFLNGKAIVGPPNYFGGYPIEIVNSTKWCRKKSCPRTVITRLKLGVDGSITVTAWKGFLYVDVYAVGAGFRDSVGLLGKRDIVGKFARNGTILQDDRTYAEEWQVLDTEPALFLEKKYPQYPDRCIIPPKGQVFRRSPNINRRMAMKACSQVTDGAKDACMFDVMATGDIDMALPYE